MSKILQEIIIPIFAGVGFVVVCMAIFLVFSMIILLIIDGIKEYKRKYQYKYNKTPIAKCYCKDCIYYENDDYCGYIRKKTPEDGFCYRAKINE